ncbi:hypothetical protein EJB05_47608, partial [Eragrostis curvula]
MGNVWPRPLMIKFFLRATKCIYSLCNKWFRERNQLLLQLYIDNVKQMTLEIYEMSGPTEERTFLSSSEVPTIPSYDCCYPHTSSSFVVHFT